MKNINRDEMSALIKYTAQRTDGGKLIVILKIKPQITACYIIVAKL